MKKSSLLTAGAAVAIVGVAVVGGYFVDRLPADQAELAMRMPTPEGAAPAAAPAKADLKTTTTASRGVTGAVSVPQPPPKTTSSAGLNTTAPDGALVAITGTVTDKKGNTLMLKEPAGSVRVVMREDTPRPREVSNYVSTADKIGIGAPVTVYGKLRTDEDMPKVYADAVYDPATKKLYALNERVTGNKTAQQLTTAEITSRYTPVGSMKASRIAVSKTSDTKNITER